MEFYEAIKDIEKIYIWDKDRRSAFDTASKYFDSYKISLIKIFDDSYKTSKVIRP